MDCQLEKKGSFRASLAVVGNPGRCGNPTNQDFGYEVKIGINADSLDDNDFVFDHNQIQAYFNSLMVKAIVIPSCEMLALRALKYFYDALAEKPKYIKVSVIADSVSHNVVWDNEKAEGPPEVPESKSLTKGLAELAREAA